MINHKDKSYEGNSPLSNMREGRFAHRRWSDRADSSVVTFVLVFPLFFALIVTMIDTSIYLANRSVIQQSARDATRTVAILGGSGTDAYQTPLELAYGQPNPCLNTDIPEEVRAWSKNSTPVECNLADRLSGGSGLTNVTFEPASIDCGPTKALYVGNETYCKIDWKYGGIPGSTLNFIAVNSASAGKSNGSLLHSNVTRVTSESEVSLVDQNCVRRPEVMAGATC